MDKKTLEFLDSILPKPKNAEEQRKFMQQFLQYANEECRKLALRDPIAKMYKKNNSILFN